MRITGLDLSLTSTGVAQVRLGEPSFPPVQVYRLKAAARLGTGHERLGWLLEEIGRHIKGTDLCALEGPSYDSPLRQHALGGLWWLVAHGLWCRRIPYVVITPGQLKMYATGKGNASKDAVLAAVVRRYLQVEVTGNDEADGLVLAAMTAHKLGAPLVQGMPKTHTRALDLVNWPEAFCGTPDHQTA